MQTTLYQRPNSQQLILYFAGWGTSPALVHHWDLPHGYDLLCCSDYRQIDFTVDLTGYQHYHLVAWSMGVWAAEQSLPPLPFTTATAINGTPLAIHDDYGIPTAIFAGTLAQFSPANQQKFLRRMCGSAARLTRYQQTPAPDFAQAKQELAAIAAQYPDRHRAHIHWTKAIIGEKDAIFPAANQLAYWQPILQKHGKIAPLAAPHFLFPELDGWQAIWQ